MYRCVVLHRNGTTELEEVKPALHQKLRHLEYKRFVVEFVRDADGISVTAPLYCQFSPSSWQASNAAKQLWGRQSGTVRLFDEDGHLVQDSMASGGTPFQGSTAIPATPAASAPGSSAVPTAAGDSGAGDQPRFTREDVELVNALASFAQDPSVPDSAFGAVSREVVMQKLRDLALRLAKVASK
jgi:hypothetical protein